MGKNPDGSSNVEDDNKEVTEQDLRDLKYPKDGVETAKTEDETETDETEDKETTETGEEDGKTTSETTEETETEDKTEESDNSQYVKEFPNIKGDTLEAYARELEQTIHKSNTEGKRLSDRLLEVERLLAERPESKTEDKEDKAEDGKTTVADPLSLYMQQKMDEEIQTAYTKFSADYPQVNDQSEYAKFTREVAVVSNTIMQTQKRLATPGELYAKAAVILGWEKENVPSTQDKLKIAVKDRAAISKSNSITKNVSKSKVTPNMIAVNRMMYPGKSDDDIRKELEPYVQ